MSIEPPEREPHPRNPWWWRVGLLGAVPVPVALLGRRAEPAKPDEPTAVTEPK